MPARVLIALTASDDGRLTGGLSRAAGMRQIAEILGEGRVAIPADPPAHARIEEMIGFFLFLERRMPELLAEWDQLRRVEKPAP